MATPDTSIQHLVERKCKITGRVHRIGEIIEVAGKFSQGFRQHVWLHIPALKDDLTGRAIRAEQYYQVEIYSNKKDDRRFLGAKNMRELVCCSVYLNSWHFVSPKDGLVTGMRLNFIEWLKVEK